MKHTVPIWLYRQCSNYSPQNGVLTQPHAGSVLDAVQLLSLLLHYAYSAETYWWEILLSCRLAFTSPIGIFYQRSYFVTALSLRAELSLDTCVIRFHCTVVPARRQLQKTDSFSDARGFNMLTCSGQNYLGLLSTEIRRIHLKPQDYKLGAIKTSSSAIAERPRYRVDQFGPIYKWKTILRIKRCRCQRNQKHWSLTR